MLEGISGFFLLCDFNVMHYLAKKKYLTMVPVVHVETY